MACLIPEGLARTVRGVYGDAGDDWLAALPELVAELSERWKLRVASPFPNLTYTWVAPAMLPDGSPVVLKVGVPDRELRAGIAALHCFDGRGAVRLLAADPERGAQLLERAAPGRPLATHADDEAATRIAAAVMQRLWRPLPAEHPFPTVTQWAGGLARLRAMYDGGTGPLPARLVAEAEALFRDLLASAAPPLLLHGDLHHDNIVAATREPWLAIDPKGVAGEPAYEAAALLRNPYRRLAGNPDAPRLLDHRLAVLSEVLGIERARLRGWGIAQTVLSAWWSLEDGGDWRPDVVVAMHLSALPE